MRDVHYERGRGICVNNNALLTIVPDFFFLNNIKNRSLHRLLVSFICQLQVLFAHEAHNLKLVNL